MKKMTAFLLLVLACTLLTSCGSSKSAVANTEGNYDAGGVYDSYAGPQEAVAEAEQEEGMGSESVPLDKGQKHSRKLIRNMSMDVETQDYEKLLTTVEARVKELGGYVEQLNAYNENNTSNRNASMTLRIPAENLDTFVKQVEEHSNIVNRQESVEDVTLQYVDLESHQKMLKEEQERLMEFLESAETMEDIITLESRLTEVRYQLESMEAQLRQMDNQVDYSTVYLNITEVARFSPSEEKTAWQRIKTGFGENVYRVTHGIGNFAVEFVIALPILIFLAILLLLMAVIVHFIRKANEKRALRYKARKASAVQGAQYRQYQQAGQPPTQRWQQAQQTPPVQQGQQAQQTPSVQVGQQAQQTPPVQQSQQTQQTPPEQ